MFVSFEENAFISSFGWDSTVLTVASTAGAAAVCNWLYKAMQTAYFKKQMHPFSVVKYLDYEMFGSLAVKVCEHRMGHREKEEI